MLPNYAGRGHPLAAEHGATVPAADHYQRMPTFRDASNEHPGAFRCHG